MARRAWRSAAVAVQAAAGSSACEVGQSTGERALGGAAVGAAASGAYGLLRGDFLGNAFGGAAAGAAGGFVDDQVKRR